MNFDFAESSKETKLKDKPEYKAKFFRFGITLFVCAVIAAAILVYTAFLDSQSKRITVPELPKASDDKQLATLEEKNLLEARQRCKSEGEKFYQRYKKEHPHMSTLDPTYSYNKKLNTCLISMFEFYIIEDGKTRFGTENVYDLLTNRVVISCHSEFCTGEERDDFKEKERELMSSEELSE